MKLGSIHLGMGTWPLVPNTIQGTLICLWRVKVNVEIVNMRESESKSDSESVCERVSVKVSMKVRE